MPQREQVEKLMNEHQCSRTKANNMLRKRANGNKDPKTGQRTTKRRSIAK